MRILHFGLALQLAYRGLSSIIPHEQYPFGSYTSSGGFDWSSIEPADTLKWHACYELHECARFQVPLDWQHPEHGENASLAVIRLPAVVPRSHPRFGGSIFINPGGPGGSGVHYLLSAGLELQTKIDGAQHFEIISWDPRGVAYSTPSASCFTSDLDRQAFDLRLAAVGDASTSDAAFMTLWAGAKGFGRICNDKRMKYMSTLSSVHDMIAMLDALDPTNNKPLLNYWGFSYGTFLGNTFASVFPDRIGRMVLDGVVDANDYRSASWLTNLEHTDDVLEFFYEICWQAGDKCPISRDSLDDVKLTVEALLEKIKYEPLPVSVEGWADFVQHSDVISIIFLALYCPVQQFPPLAEALAGLLHGNTSRISTYLQRIRKAESRWPQNEHLVRATEFLQLVHPSTYASSYPHQEDAGRTISCVDADDVSHRTVAQHKEHLKKLQSQSKLAAGIWSQIPAWCVHWPQELRPDKGARFAGSFGSKASDYDPNGSPIVFIGSVGDPVTPLSNAYKMSKLHEGSGVIKVLQNGHTTGSTNPNDCVYNLVSNYFDTGVMPAHGIVCPAEKITWQ